MLHNMKFVNSVFLLENGRHTVLTPWRLNFI